ncbi:YhcN/YlaJ family sporulation lipoprotein [Bacillus sp. 179-C3.3 HS]|uniref:YhcN/YlaJ family sporulation lipoprotein n=1 Tax=Bacillus sp. 179-C3.3 HS TaxID=3232162 RepID=UPI0039A0CC27
MRQKWQKVFVLLLLPVGLTACGANDNAGVNTRYNQSGQPVGYHSNQQATDNNNQDHQGPVSELMDGMDGNNRNNRNNGNNGNNGNNDITNVSDRNGDQGRMPLAGGDGRYSHGDMNYHDQMAFTGYDKQENVQRSRKIANRVNKMNHVTDSQVMVTDENVYIAIKSDGRFTSEGRSQLEEAVKRYADGRAVQVFEDEGAFTRFRDMRKTQFETGQTGMTR